MIRPPNDRGQGRKPLQPGIASCIVPIRMTPEQRAKVQRLGGAQWVRDRIDKAKEPKLRAVDAYLKTTKEK